MNEDELDELLAEGVAKDKEWRESEAQRIKELKRQRLLEREWAALNVTPDNFNSETGEFPEVDDFPFCPPPPASYWRWYAKRVIRVANRIVEDGWKPKLEQLDIPETNGRIAVGLLLHAMKGDVDSLAKKIEKAVMRHEDGPQAKAWLAVRLVDKLTAQSQMPVSGVSIIESQIPIGSCENPEEAVQGTRISTEEVQERLLRRARRGDEYPSRRQLAKEIGSSYYRVDMAIKGCPELQTWERSRNQKRPTGGINEVVAEGLTQQREEDPAKIVERKDEADIALRKLIENAKEPVKAKYLEILTECNGDSELTILRIQQLKDDRNNKIRDRG